MVHTMSAIKQNEILVGEEQTTSLKTIRAADFSQLDLQSLGLDENDYGAVMEVSQELSNLGQNTVAE